jgi:hypothetical protein
LIGVATSTSAIHNALPRSITNLLETANFFVEPGIAAFNVLIRGLFIEWDSPLSIGPKVYDYLLKTFEDSHHSIDATISGLQYVYMRNFDYRAALFILPPNQTTKEYLANPDLIEDLQKVPSVVKPLSRPSTFKKDVDALMNYDLDAVDRCREYRKVWQRKMRSGFDLLCLLQTHWSKKFPTEILIGKLMNGTLSEHSNSVCDLILWVSLRFSCFRPKKLMSIVLVNRMRSRLVASYKL